MLRLDFLLRRLFTSTVVVAGVITLTFFVTRMLALGLAWWPLYAVLVGGEVVRLAGLPYVETARSIGASPLRIAHRHLLPNARGPLLVQATVDVGVVILVASGLSFIGLGSQPPTADWGR